MQKLIVSPVVLSLLILTPNCMQVNKRTQSSTILKECFGLRGKFRRACKSISRDPVLVQYEKYLKLSAKTHDPLKTESRRRTILIGGLNEPVLPLTPQCSPFNIYDGNLPDNLRSLSPWVFEVTYDPNRFPQQLAEARCICDYCIDPVHQKENKNLKAALVTKKTLVLKKVKDDGLPFANCTKKTCTDEYIETGISCHCLPVLNADESD